LKAKTKGPNPTIIYLDFLLFLLILYQNGENIEELAP
jgi:hypothetical protein